jgi:hypothetical protein
VVSINTERKIDGKVFLELSREDIAAIFPDYEKFILGMRLYKLIQSYRDDPTTQELLADLSDQFSDVRSSSTNSGHKRSLSLSESSSQLGRPLQHVLQPLPCLSFHSILNVTLHFTRVPNATS